MKQPKEGGIKYDLVRYRIETAKSDVESAKILYEAGVLRGANNRAYYGIYHAISAISTLSGAAATNAALAWLGGGALAAGGGGMTAGNALLALAGPIGWSIAGATFLSSILIFTTKKAKLNKQKNEEIQAIKENIEAVREMDAKIQVFLTETERIRVGLNEMLTKNLFLYNLDYASASNEEKMLLGVLVNNTKAL